jgi:regulatory protein
MPEANIQLRLRRVVLNLLARRDHTYQELIKKLQKRFLLADIKLMLDKLIQQDFINEERFTNNFIEVRRRKGFGPKRIKLELQNRGIKDQMIAEHLKMTDNAWLNEIRKTWQTYFKNKLPINFKEQAKQMRFLQYRGFTLEQINSLFKNIYEND